MRVITYENDLILRAARGQIIERTPVWVMRQAGRYLPEFREIRKSHEFFDLCKIPSLCAEITLQPIRRYNLDAAILFSDILVIPQALGMDLKMIPGVGPVFSHPIESIQDILKLDSNIDVTKKLAHVYESIELTCRELNGRIPLLGFTGGPWTLMAYMIEGKGSKTFAKAKSWLFTHKEESKMIIEILTNTIIDHLELQIVAGVAMVQVFESWAGALTPDLFMEFLYPQLCKIVNVVKERISKRGIDNVPFTIFAMGAHYAIEELGKSEYDVIGLDSTMDPVNIRKLIPITKSLQGNLDPCILFADKEVIIEETKKMLDRFGTQSYIANLGHGMMPEHPVESLETFVNTVHNVSEQLIKEENEQYK